MQKINLTLFLVIFQNFLLWFLIEKFGLEIGLYSVFYIIWIFDVAFLFVYFLDNLLQKKLENNQNLIPKFTDNIHKNISGLLIFFTIIISFFVWFSGRHIFLLMIMIALTVAQIILSKIILHKVFFFKKPMIPIYSISIISIIMANISMYLFVWLNVIFRLRISCMAWLITLLTIWWFWIKMRRIWLSTIFRFYMLFAVLSSFVLILFVYWDLNSWFGIKDSRYKVAYFENFVQKMCRSVSQQSFLDLKCEKMATEIGSNVRIIKLDSDGMTWNIAWADNQKSYNSAFSGDNKDNENTKIDNISQNASWQISNQNNWPNQTNPERLVTYRDVVRYFFTNQVYSWPELHFQNISTKDKNYNEFAMAYDRRTIWLDIVPSKTVYCDIYIVMKWIKNSWNVKIINPKNPFDPYWDEAVKLDKLNGCKKWELAKYKNL